MASSARDAALAIHQHHARLSEPRTAPSYFPASFLELVEREMAVAHKRARSAPMPRTEPPEHYGRKSRISEEEIAEAYKRYQTGESLGDITEDCYARWGYASVESARSLLRKLFEVRGLKTRTKSEAMTLMYQRRRENPDHPRTLYRAMSWLKLTGSYEIICEKYYEVRLARAIMYSAGKKMGVKVTTTRVGDVVIGTVVKEEDDQNSVTQVPVRPSTDSPHPESEDEASQEYSPSPDKTSTEDVEDVDQGGAPENLREQQAGSSNGRNGFPDGASTTGLASRRDLG